MSPAKKAALTAVKDAATFDVAAWLEDLRSSGFKPRNVEVKMHFRGDLLPRMKYLISQIQRLQGEDEVERETGVDEADPLSELIAEYNQVEAEFKGAGFLTFTFRPMNKRIQNDTFLVWKETHPEDSPDAEAQEELILARMAASCVSFPGSDKLPPNTPIPPAAFTAFEDAYGTPAFNTLIQGFLEAYEAGGEVDAPFLPNASRGQGTAE